MGRVGQACCYLLAVAIVAHASSQERTQTFDRRVARRPECMRPPLTGRCRAHFNRFAWNHRTQQCEEFIYGGCGGNGNRFRSRHSCEETCRPVEPCDEGWFECSDRRCIRGDWRGNGRRDCHDGEDEEGYIASTEPATTSPPMTVPRTKPIPMLTTRPATTVPIPMPKSRPAITVPRTKPTLVPTTRPAVEWRNRRWGSCYPKIGVNVTSCGPLSGQQKRRRVCYIAGTRQKALKNSLCEGPRFQTQSCEYAKCPVHGGFSEWSEWSNCSAPCGKSHQSRRRFCDNPPPRYGGRPCKGNAVEKRPCKVPPCPGHGRRRTKMCRRDPCRNGGTCFSRGRGFTCTCPPTHTGPICQFPSGTILPAKTTPPTEQDAIAKRFKLAVERGG